MTYVHIMLLCLALFFAILFFINMEFFVADNKMTDDEILDSLRIMLRVTDEIFNKNDITYWMDSGTLLGAIRHEDIIPWDDDADIVIFPKDEQKFLSLRKEFNKYGYDLGKAWCGYKIFPLDGKPIKYHNRNWSWGKENEDIEKDEIFEYKYPFIDVIMVDKMNNTFNYVNEKVRRVWPNYYNNADDVFPLKRYKFNNFELNGPRDPLPFLNRAYGNDWSYMGYKQYDHENQIILDKTKFEIPITHVAHKV